MEKLIEVVSNNLRVNKTVKSNRTIYPVIIKEQVATLRRMYSGTTTSLAKKLNIQEKSIRLWTKSFVVNVSLNSLNISDIYLNSDSRLPVCSTRPLTDEDIKSRFANTLASIPIIRVQGDVITSKEQTLIDDWLKTNKPKRFIGSTQVQ